MITSTFVPKGGKKGGYASFEVTLYNTVSKNIRHMAGKFYSILSEEDIEDLVHDTYLRIIENIHKMDSSKNTNGWVYRICRNRVYDYCSAISKRLDWMEDLDEGYDDENASYDLDCTPELADYSYCADSALERKEFEQNFWRNVNKLTPEHKDIAIMLIEETPYSEMAQTLGCSEDTLRVRIYRTRKALQKMGIAD